MPLQEMLVVVVGILCCAMIAASLFVTSFWAIFDCARSNDYSKTVNLRWLMALIIGYAIFVPSFIYGRYVTKSMRLRAFTKFAFIALILSSVTIFGAMMTAKDFLSPISSGKNAKVETPPDKRPNQ